MLQEVSSSAPAQQHLKPRGSNQGGVREFNERVVLQAIRLHGPTPKAELARLTHLSAQAISLIIAGLLDDGLVLKLEPVRGKVGQPSVPIALDPNGAFTLGIEIGRRNADVLLMDFAGQVRERRSVSYAFPDPQTLFDRLQALIDEVRASLGPALARRLCGAGVAAPLSIGGWQQVLGISDAQAHHWDGVDIRKHIEAITGLPVEFAKDTAAACVAELVAGRGRSMRTFLHVFVDTFIGGGLVIDSHLRGGVHGNAGAVGSLALSVTQEGQHTPAQLLSSASLFNLERLFTDAGLDPTACSEERALQGEWLPHTQAWLRQAAGGIALAIHNAACLLDLEAVIVDGAFHKSLLDALMQSITRALDAYSWEGVWRPQVLPGTIGSDARAIGGALLPLYAQFAPDRDLFLKLGA
jgi:predicted NBD/HSP70 family sugar kinase